MDSQKPEQKKSRAAIAVMGLLALIMLIIFYFQMGFIVAFFVCLALWIVFFFIYFRFLFAIALLTPTLLFLAIFAISIGLLVTANPKESSTVKSATATPTATSTPTVTATKAAENFTLVKCASKATDVPVLPPGYTNIIYSGPYSRGNTVGPDKANNVRTFSFKAQTDGTANNTMYSYTSRPGKDKNGNPLLITGDTVTMEVCNADNMANKFYSISSQKYPPAGSSTIWNLNYFSGGQYLTGPGTYRIDAYLKIGSDNWQLINRMTGITVTE